MLETTAIGSLTLLTAEPEPAAAKRPPILFIPGYFAGAWVFDRFLPYFADRGYPGIAVNLRGRGGSALRRALAFLGQDPQHGAAGVDALLGAATREFSLAAIPRLVGQVPPQGAS